MKKWGDITSGGQVYSMAHLQPFTIQAEVAGRIIDMNVGFEFHVFTDEKGNGIPFNLNGESRFFCPVRHNDSHQAVHYMQTRLESSHTRPFFTKGGGQQFYVLDIHDYAIFLTVQKPQGTTNVLNCRVVSAYAIDSWGRAGLPKTTVRNMSYVLDMKEQGIPIPIKKK